MRFAARCKTAARACLRIMAWSRWVSISARAVWLRAHEVEVLARQYLLACQLGAPPLLSGRADGRGAGKVQDVWQTQGKPSISDACLKEVVGSHRSEEILQRRQLWLWSSARFDGWDVLGKSTCAVRYGVRQPRLPVCSKSDNSSTSSSSTGSASEAASAPASAPVANAAGGKTKIGFSVSTLNNAFFVGLTAGVEKGAKEQGLRSRADQCERRRAAAGQRRHQSSEPVA